MHYAFPLPASLDWYSVLVVVHSLAGVSSYGAVPLSSCHSSPDVITMSAPHPTGSMAVAVKEVPDVTH